jgi:hypothetical protein
LPQVTAPRVITQAKLRDGLHLICWGFFKKVFIADNLAPIVGQAFSAPSPAGFDTLLGIYAFAFQIYCDFSGYTDIAGRRQNHGLRVHAEFQPALRWPPVSPISGPAGTSAFPAGSAITSIFPSAATAAGLTKPAATSCSPC